MVVAEAMAGLAVLLHIVLDPGGGERLLETGRRATEHPVPPAIAADDGARMTEETGRVHLFGPGGHSVVDARGREAVIRREQQRQPAAHAVADHTDRPGAVLPVRQPFARGIDVAERGARPGACLTRARGHGWHLSGVA